MLFQSLKPSRQGQQPIDDAELAEMKQGIPGAGSCGGMYTANTMASAMKHWV